MSRKIYLKWKEDNKDGLPVKQRIVFTRVRTSGNEAYRSLSRQDATYMKRARQCKICPYKHPPFKFDSKDYAECLVPAPTQLATA